MDTLAQAPVGLTGRFSQELSPPPSKRGRDIHMYETRGRENYRTGRHRTVVCERLPSQAGVNFLNRLPNSIKTTPTPKAFKARLKRLLVSHAFYNADEFFEFDWETTQLE
ncbi:hypothetical protein J6590_015496 [Homalodisca vitripennis]|nr:hypothetical protein J6590_015496 [Homalodisca vitripennis]